ncbi:MAG: ABC transporter permease [Phycisphaerae bacterium]|nr:ABC transporter permease [Phycisphaerae bacterium]
MFTYILKRILLAIPTLFGITVIIFSITHLAPGDPAQIASQSAGGQMSSEMSQRVYEELKKQYHLDKPITTQYWYWLAGDGERTKGIIRGDFGSSMSPDNRPVIDKINERLWPTMSLAMLAIGSSIVFGIPIGIMAATRRNGIFDKVSSTVLYGLYSVPSYVMAWPLILIFAVKLEWLPFQNMVSDNHEELSSMDKIFDLAKHYVLITVCSTYGSWAFYSRFVRQNMLEVLQQDYIRTARAKGLDERTITIKHAFRNTLIPVATLLSMTLPALIGGSVILENIFNWPGMGRLFFESMMQRDFATIMALSTISAVLIMTAILLADLTYALVDPRVKYD